MCDRFHDQTNAPHFAVKQPISDWTFLISDCPTQEPRKEPVWPSVHISSVCDVFEILVVLFQVCGDHGSLSDPAHALLATMVIKRSGRFHHRFVRTRLCGSALRSTRLGICLVRGRVR